ncbi:MAG: MFS transporter [Asgard group archaeon]|nr:MFS transporter [Asgard group archaeon]
MEKNYFVSVTEEEYSTLREEIEIENLKPSLRNILKNKSYMLVFGGQISNMIATMLAGMTFSYLIYSTTGNAALMALMGILGSLPTIIIVTFAGILVDRVDQRKLIVISIIMRAVLLIGFLVVFLFMSRLIQTYEIYEPFKNGIIFRITITKYVHFIWPMYALLFINNAVFTLYNLTVSTYSKYIVKKKDLLVANSFNSTITQIASVIGPILAGMLISVSYLYSFLISIFITSIAAIICSFLLKHGKNPPKKEKSEKLSAKKEISKVFSDMKIGFNAIRSEPKVMYVLLVYMGFNFVVASVNGTFSVVLQGEMTMNATWYGAVVAVMSGFGIITSLVIMKLGKINRKLIIVNLVIFLEAIGLFLFTFVRNPWIMLFVITIPFGIVNGGANIPSFTLRQEKIPHEKLGRATSFVFLFTSLMNLFGMVIVTSVANRVSPMYILLVGSCLCLLLSITSFIFMMSRNELRSTDYTEDHVETKQSDQIEAIKETINQEISDDLKIVLQTTATATSTD